MMEGGGYLNLEKKKGFGQEFAQTIFSWSLDDILNQDLYKAEKIPLTFNSHQHYFGSFIYPLLEETRAELASSMEIMYRAPFAEIFLLNEAKGKGKLLYDVTVGNWRNIFCERGKEPYRLLPGDLFILMDGKPESVFDLQHMGRGWAFSLVSKTVDDDNENYSTSLRFKVKASREIEFHHGMFVVFLMNITTHKRIWNSLHLQGNQNIINEVLQSDFVVKENCDRCSIGCKGPFSQKIDQLSVKLNESQRAAIIASLHNSECSRNSSIEQIWGPPGTGKTTTISVMLFILWQMNRRMLSCAPTNVAIVQVALRLLKLVRESRETKTESGDYFWPVGDVLLFGNMERLQIGIDTEDIHLEHRIKKLIECFGPLTGWKHFIRSMIDLLENCVSQYHVFLENKLKEKNHTSFLEFLRERFNACALPLRQCFLTFCTHVPRSFMHEDNFQNMISLLNNLSSLKSLLFQDKLVSKEVKKLFFVKPVQDDFHTFEDMSSISYARHICCSLLKTLQTSLDGLGLPSVLDSTVIKDFCFQRASLVFCTTSTSYKLHLIKMEPLNLLVIDEAAQVKEAESIIPLQLPGIKHAILIGDECQLPALVKSNVSTASGFGRSLFERLSSLGHSKHLLNIQYRMHPSISLFPNCNFYQNHILDSENVSCKSYEKQYLPGEMFSSYSFINVVGGREERVDDGQSLRNMVEVALVIRIVQNLYRACSYSKQKLSIGVVSPYAAQAVAIQERIAHKYEKLDGFSVKVKSIDGFQGAEEDTVILSTVRSNIRGSVGFLSSPQRINVALTRAQHNLWILGNEITLANSQSIWKGLVCDARNRHCLFDADTDECLKRTIVAVKKELAQLEDLADGNSVLFKDAKWKVLFSNDFKRSFGALRCSGMKKKVLNLLLKLSTGWRPKSRSIDLYCENSSQIVKQFKVEGVYVICTIDIIKEFKYIQVLRVWDVLPVEEIPKMKRRLESIFAVYTDDYINRCTEKCLEGNLEIPRSWAVSEDFVQFRKLSKFEGDCEVSTNPAEGKNYVENSKVNESLLLMKFYSLSSGVVNNLLSGREHDLPMQVSDEQMDIILCNKSSFIIGRSGTGKTTILTMKLFQNEQCFHVASEGFSAAESSQARGVEIVDGSGESKPTVLRQLFVSVSPKLCHAVKQDVSQLTSCACDGNSSTEINIDDLELASEFSDIPNTFVDLPKKHYPLVITFHKFLMMLDGTLGNSFFERFHEARVLSDDNHISSKSVALQTFIRRRTVTFDRFSSLYWPHFNANLTKKLDPSIVFTEIISHIKGGLQAGENHDGKLCYKGYSLLSEGRTSTLMEDKREMVYTLFQAYEKLKTKRGEFDLGDFVNDVHRRLNIGNYKGDIMDFVYVDEVQDLTMRQISLFKYICKNVDGFIFAGDTAQTIARGIDFRFQDIRSLFYNEFLSNITTCKKEKGLVSEIYQLKQNFRTHAGVLELSQSVIDILYCYFAHAIDVLEPETSLISGEAPVILESGNDENAIVTIFGGKVGSEEVSFGAEQVILVRDDRAKTDICELVGKQALVLTILECKGLEFQDVFLYNFFESSPLKDQWRVIYGYMKGRDLLDDKFPQSFPSFSESRHNVLCSELKQLYVSITRTRQRLWICESKRELCKPMFDYWNKRGLVQVRKLDDSVALAMRAASNPQEWRERGKKLFYENNFVMATICFERSGDASWEKLSKASGLRTSAERMRGTNPEAALGYLRDAGEIFEFIGKHEPAATCYCDLGDYVKAGKIYLEKCGKINAAAECFMLAGCYSDAAEVYAKGGQFSNCLSACKKGKLFDKGMRYIEYWREHTNERRKEIEQTEQDFLESCALDFHKRKDTKSMMNFVRAFRSMESKRVYLSSLGCLDELLVLEEESGHFLDAAKIVGSWGDDLKEADLMEKAGHHVETALLLVWFVFSSSLWGKGNRGWPLKHFSEKEEICKKAKSLAKMDSDVFYGFVCCELNVLSNEQSCLSELKKHLHASQEHKSLRGEIVSIRRILDAHLDLNILMYDREEKLHIDTNKYVEDMISQNRVSVISLVHYWNLWKANVVDILKSIECLQNKYPVKHGGHVDFSLNYFGVRELRVNTKILYIIVKKDADWLRSAGSLHRDGKILSLDGKPLVCAMRSYWQSELLCVGVKVLEVVKKLASTGSAFHQSTSLLQIFEVYKFLVECKHLNLTFYDKSRLQSFHQSCMSYFDLVFQLDWRKSDSKDLISLRETDLSLNLLEEIILQDLYFNNDPTYWTIGRVIMICIGYRKPVSLHKNIITALQKHPSWKSFLDEFFSGSLNNIYVAQALQKALEDTYRANWKRPGYISPHSFVYLLDYLLFMTSFSSEVLLTTKSSFVGWFMHHQSALKQIHPENAISFLAAKIKETLCNIYDTISWIERSKIDPSYLSILALKLVMMLSIICLRESDCSQVLLDLLRGKNSIANWLPVEFVSALLRRRKGPFLNLDTVVVAEAFISVEDPLLIGILGNESPRIHAPCAIFVDLTRSSEDIMNVLFPNLPVDGCKVVTENELENACLKP